MYSVFGLLRLEHVNNEKQIHIGNPGDPVLNCNMLLGPAVLVVFPRI